MKVSEGSRGVRGGGGAKRRRRGMEGLKMEGPCREMCLEGAWVGEGTMEGER